MPPVDLTLPGRAWRYLPPGDDGRDGIEIAWIVTALVGCLIVWLFFGGHTPAPAVPATTGTP